MNQSVSALLYVALFLVIIRLYNFIHIERVKENLGAVNVKLTDEEYNSLNKELDKIKIYGNRDSRDIAKLATVPDDAH